MVNFRTCIFIVFLFLPGVLTVLHAQPNATVDLKKPKKYENKILASEKSGEKKFSAPRRFIQNTVTHYNWVFNAQNRLNDVIDRAKYANQDDFSQLLPFYNYSLDITQRDSSELDSVLYKSNTAILIHDLRNDWIDNLYMVMGSAYFHKKLFDSAYITFQYINYAWAPKEKDGYDKPIGSNAGEDGNAMTVSTKENPSILKKAVSSPPSRNDALIWQIRTFIEMEEYGRAAALIQTLHNDPLFPERLHSNLNEMKALLFYRQSDYDSAAYYLQHSLSTANTKNERARQEYLTAQLYERAGKHEEALVFYKQAIRHTYDPVMEVYARLNSIRQNKGDSNAIRQNIAELIKMGRKDRYSRYRDIIYFTAAQIELERNNIPAAKEFLLKSALASNPELPVGQRGKSYKLLGDLSFADHEFANAKRFYDSINTSDPVITDQVAFASRLETLNTLMIHQGILQRQDSLQRLAAMPEADRDAYIKKRVRQLRKMQGLKEDEMPSSAGGSINPNNPNTAPSDLFSNNAKGEWYFYNQAVKSKGYTAFKSKWGNRPNVDNWRRASAVNAARAVGEKPVQGPDTSLGISDPESELSYESLLKNIPLTPEQLDISNDSIENAMIDLGRIYMEGMEAYTSVIELLEPFPGKFPESARMPEVLFYLYYSYKQTGNDKRANEITRILQDRFAGHSFERRVSNVVNKNDPDPDKTAATTKYNEIYNMFIEGRFDEAVRQKNVADSLYGMNYWTPQLLYIEAIYLIRQRNDSAATRVLQQLNSLYPGSPMEEKSVTLLDVLSRRKEIEDYLTNLDIQRPKEDETIVIPEKPQVIQRDTVLVTSEEPIPEKPVKDAEVKKTEPEKTVPVVVKTDSIAKSNAAPVPKFFTFTPDASHMVAVVTNNVDPVYVNEARNAFNRFNQTKYYNKKIDIVNETLNDTVKLVVMTGFANSAEALEYAENTGKIAATQIVPWLPAGKYSFIIISAANLELLKTINSMDEYRAFLEKHYPGKFN